MQKPLVFISHITEEKELAQALKHVVEAAFLNMIDVFVSSDPTSISLGRKWLDEITHALKTCTVEIILASPESVKRPWINFEGGSGWIREIPVIPLCHSGMTPAKLPAPLNSLQAATATEESQLKLIFPVLAGAIGCCPPELDFSEFVAAVTEFENVSQQIKEMAAVAPVATTDGLTAHELATLVEIAEQSSSSIGTVATGHVRSALGKAGYRGIAVALALKMLARKNLVEMSVESDWHGNEQYPVVQVTDEGWHWLESNQHTLNLTAQLNQTELASQASSPAEDGIPF
jgi:hypothetical protein